MTDSAAFETWRPVYGFDDLYEVSDRGHVRRVGRAHRIGAGRGGGARIGREIAPQKHQGGYLAVQMWRHGKMHRQLLHRVVAAAFLGPCPEGKEVNHRDGVKANNQLSNLEYVSRSENMVHAYAKRLRHPSPVHGERHHNATLTDSQVVKLRSLYVPGRFGAQRLAALFGIATSTALRIATGRSRNVV